MNDLGHVLVSVVLVTGLAGCAHRAASPASAASAASHVAHAAAPATYALPVEPNGLWWDVASSTLYFASDEQHALYRWRDGSFTLAAALPAPAGRPGLGQLVRTPDGRTLVTRFGHGDGGGILVVGGDGQAALVPGLDVTRRRIGLAIAADGTLFDGYFRYDADKHEAHGGVARLSLDSGGGTEVELVGGLKKPVGVLVLGDALYASDQDADVIVRAPLSSPADARPFAQLAQPDLLCAGDAGAFFAASKSGGVYRVAPDGQVARVVAGLRPVRGIAWDGAGRRLFVVERRGKDDSQPPTLHVLQLH